MSNKKFRNLIRFDKRKVFIFNIFLLIFSLYAIVPCGYSLYYCNAWARGATQVLNVINVINLPVFSFYTNSQELLYPLIINNYSSNIDTAIALTYKISLVGLFIALIVYWAILANLVLFIWDRIRKK
jgi:hypothetical protein